MPEGARSARVLVADGSEDEREMYAMQLAQAGFDVLEAADGLTAWTLARRGVDVVIADERLPKLSGLELCRRLKTDAATRRTRVVVLTSGADVWDTVQEALRAGADAVRLKPCYPETLQADIRRLLAGTARPAPARGPRRARAVGIGKAATARAAGPRICPHCRRRLRLLTMPGGVGEILVRCPGSCGRWLVDRGRLRRVS